MSNTLSDTRFTINVELDCDLGERIAQTRYDGNVANICVGKRARPRDLRFIISHEAQHAISTFLQKGKRDDVWYSVHDRIINDIILKGVLPNE